MWSAIVVAFICLATATEAFQPHRHGARPSNLQMSLAGSFQIAELFSSPAVRYGGELVDKSLKLVEKVPKPEGYAYGAVDAAGTPALGAGLFAVIALAAAVPYFLSIGESAQTQQRVREANDKTVNNQFALGKKNSAVNAGVKKGIVVGVKKSGVAAAAAPAVPAKKATSPGLSFGAKAKTAAPAAAPAAAAKKSSPLSFGGAAKKAAPAPAAAVPAKKASPLSFGGAAKKAAPAPAAATPVKKAAPSAAKKASKIPAFGPR